MTRPDDPSRREFIKRVAAGLGGAALPGLAGAELSGVSLKRKTNDGKSRPNVILAFSDQHRWQSMSFTETPKVLTPQMARMATQGFSANNLVANYPLCSPARAMLMTGRWPWQTGVVDNSTPTYSALKKGETTLGTVFSDAGYETCYIGKWHLGAGAKTVKSFGFAHSIVWTKTNHHWDSRYTDLDGVKKASDRYNATHMTDQLLDFIAMPRERPFFATVSWNPPHSDYIDAPSEITALYPDEEAMPLRGNCGFPKHRPEVAFAERYRGYHAHITAIDRELGRLRTSLTRLGLADDTLLIYMSDHGGMVASHGLFGKRLPHAESIKVPFLTVWPEVIPSGRSTGAPLGMIDVFPTICSLADVSYPTDRPGLDFSRSILGEDMALPDSQFLMNLANVHPPEIDTPTPPADLFRGVTDERYTYAVTDTKPWVLFDNREDPLQLRNLIDDTEHTATRKRLHQLTRDWLKVANDSFPIGSRGGAGS